MIACGLAVASVLVTVSIRCCSSAKPWFARNPAPAAVASRSITVIGCGAVGAAVLVTESACGCRAEPSPPGKPELAEVEDGGVVTVVVGGRDAHQAGQDFRPGDAEQARLTGDRLA